MNSSGILPIGLSRPLGPRTIGCSGGGSAQSGGTTYLVTLDLITYHPESLALELVADQVFFLEGAGKLAVSHDSPFGLVTFFDADDLDINAATMLDGFLVDGLFE